MGIQKDLISARLSSLSSRNPKCATNHSTLVLALNKNNIVSMWNIDLVKAAKHLYFIPFVSSTVTNVAQLI